MDLRSTVENLLSPDSTVQKEAELTLNTFLERDFENSVVRLSELVKDKDGNQILRQSAALALKNAVSSKDVSIKQQKQEAWMRVSVPARGYVKLNILEALQTDNALLGRSVAQCVAYIALCEIVRGEWQDLIQQLTTFVGAPNAGSVFRQSCLEAIGYICEEVSFQAVAAHSNSILTAIVCGMRKDEAVNDIRLAATTALYNSIDFFRGNFEKEDERNYIMTVVCEATQAQDTRLRIMALQCIVKIVQFYYDHMQPYMAKALFPISNQAMMSDVSEIILQGVEFWSTVCDSEINLNYEEAEAKDEGLIPAHKSFKFVAEYLTYVTPCLLQLLARQPDQDEGDDWVPSKAASVCLMLVAQCVQDDVVNNVLPFVAGNIANPDWHMRDAACVAFGSILEGPEPSKLKGMVDQAYDLILAMMQDDSIAVRDSAAWVVQRICQLVRESVLIEARFQNTVIMLRQNLAGPPRVAANVCWALGSLAQASYEVAQQQSQNTSIPNTFALTTVFSELVDQLFITAFRPESAQSNLRTAAFGAISDLVSHSPNDCYPTVQKTTVQVLGQLNGILEKEATLSSNDRYQYGDYCQHLLGVLQTTLRRLVVDDLSQIAEAVVRACYQILELHRLQRSFQAEPEALLCLQAILELMPQGFFKYLEGLNPHIHLGLTCYSEHSIVNGSLSLVGELCRSYEQKIVPFVPDYIDRVVRLIAQVNDPSGLVKPRAIQTLGDIALALGNSFHNYVVMSFECLRSVAVPQDHDVWLTILDGILDACVGIINGLKGDGFADQTKTVIRAYVQFIMSLIAHVANEGASVPDSTISNSATLIGEFCEMFKADIFTLVDREDFYALLNRGKKAHNEKTKTFCTWALKEIKKIKPGATVRNPAATR